jgi:hypothetical protein
MPMLWLAVNALQPFINQREFDINETCRRAYEVGDSIELRVMRQRERTRTLGITHE